MLLAKWSAFRLTGGTGLAIVAGLAVAISYLVNLFLPWGFGFRLFDLLALALGIFVAVTRLR